MAAIQEAEKILAGDGRVEELKKQVESVRAAAGKGNNSGPTPSAPWMKQRR